MNPFLHPTVATPVADGRWLGAAALAACLMVPSVAAGVDVNSASPAQLQEIKGIGPKMAQVIIDERERGGRFDSLTDLSERVKGIGPKKAAALQAGGLTVDSTKRAASLQEGSSATSATRQSGQSSAGAARRR